MENEECGMSHFQGRIAKLRNMIAGSGVNAMLVSRPENRFYLTGFTGTSGAVLITPAGACLITDFRYEEQARCQSPHCRVVLAQETVLDTLASVMEQTGAGTLGCEGDYLTQQQFTALGEKFGEGVIPLYGRVEELRRIKDETEIECIFRAADLSDRAFKHVLPLLREGVSEGELALELEFFMRREGAAGVAFPLIVASGPRSAMPHGRASDRRLSAGDMVIMDFGPILDSYCSDMTRTVAVGRADKKMGDVYRIVLEAQLAGIMAVREGVRASEVDGAARAVIEGYGFGKNFGHSTGHGLGLQIHENPRLSSRDETVLKKGMVVTVEPGIYLPGLGGVRIEDTVLVMEKGCRVLNSSPKDRLLVCG